VDASEAYTPWIYPIYCADPPVVPLPYNITEKEIEYDLGTLDSQGSPYKIRIDMRIGHCIIVLPLHQFPMNRGYYCVKKPKYANEQNVYVYLGRFFGIYTMKYDFVSPKG
jgi:hypothetical protein